MANKVPDTDSFSLRDVCDVVKQGVNTLDSCFEKANDNYFDSRYKGNKNSLLNFRNYGGDKEPAKVFWTQGGDIYGGENIIPFYNNCINSGRFEADIGNHDVLIIRWYIEFDVSQITSCTEVELRIRWGINWWNKDWGKEIVQSTANSYDPVEMFNSYDPVNLIESGRILDDINTHYDRVGVNMKLTPHAVNLINSLSKLKLLVKIADKDILPHERNMVRFAMGWKKPPILFITE